MATTGLPRTTRADLARVTESLEMLTPRWSVWVLMTLSAKPLRYTEIKPKLSWLRDGQLHPRLRKLTDAGLLERTAYAPRHVTYGLTTRGAALMPVLTVIAAWGDTHLEKDLVRNNKTGELEPEPIAPAQNIEDTLTLLAPRHATPILWALKDRSAVSAKALAAETLPGYRLSTVYPPLRQLIDDGLVEVTDTGDFQLSANGHALAPVFQALSAWAAGHPLADADAHPLWSKPSALSRTRSGPWLTTQTRLPAPIAQPAPTASPALATPPAAPWKPADLFSHQIPARPLSPAGSPHQ